MPHLQVEDLRESVHCCARSACVCHHLEPLHSNSLPSQKRCESTNSSAFWTNVNWYNESADVKLSASLVVHIMY
jgi:hypothetical protein